MVQLYTHARAQFDAGQYADALDTLNADISQNGATAANCILIGETLTQLSQQHELKALRTNGLDFFRQAAALGGDSAVPHAVLGLNLLADDLPDQALEAFEQALLRNPNCPMSLPHVLRLRRAAVRWPSAPEEARLSRLLDQGSGLAGPLNALSLLDDPAFQRRRSADYVRQLVGPPKATQPLGPGSAPGARLRIGYVSADFYEHPTMHLIRGLFRNHDQSRFEIHCFNLGPRDGGPEQTRLRQSVDGFHDLHAMPSGAVVDFIRAQNLDMVIDLKGYTKGARADLFTARLAPLQLSYLGYPGTTALKTMDYMLVDPVTVPPAQRIHYSEHMLYMPQCYQPNDDQRAAAPEPGCRADYGLPDEAFVFANFNNLYKIGPAEFDLWMGILRAAPRSVLWSYTMGRDVTARLRAEAEARGVEGARIIPAEPLAQDAHLARMAHADLGLDAFCYNGHTTASDLLRAGVPLVTLAGQQFAARVAASILTAAGQGGLVTETKEAYGETALALYRDPAGLARLRAGLRADLGALYDTKGYTRAFEALLAKAIARQKAGLAPSDLSLTAGDLAAPGAA